MKKVKVLVVAMVCLMLALSLSACIGHIEDTNGDDDFSLVTITDSDLVSGKSNSLTNNSMKTTIGNKTTHKYGKFSGIITLETIRVTTGKTITTTMSVTAGNCRLVLVKDGQIVYDFNINGSDSVTLESGTYYLRIAGESAKVDSLTYILA